MSTPENPKIGGCYISCISFLLFVFTISGAVFLLLYVTQSTSSATSWYAIIGVSLVFMPWFFWFLMILYRVISRNCGFRMMCFGSSYPDDEDDKNVPDARGESADLVSNNHVVVPVTQLTPVVARSASYVAMNGVAGDSSGGNGNTENGVANGNGNRELVSPKRVHFGGVVIMGEVDDTDTNVHQGTSEALTRSSSSSSSSSSSPSRHSNESETPLRFSMA